VKRQGVTQPRPKTAKARRSMPRLSVDITNTIGEEKSSSRSPSIVSSHDMEQSLRRLKLSTAFLGKLDRRPSSCPTNISSSSNEAQCEMASAAVVIQKTDSDVQTSARPRFREGQLIGQPLIPRFSKEQAQLFDIAGTESHNDSAGCVHNNPLFIIMHHSSTPKFSSIPSHLLILSVLPPSIYRSYHPTAPPVQSHQ